MCAAILRRTTNSKLLAPSINMDSDGFQIVRKKKAAKRRTVHSSSIPLSHVTEQHNEDGILEKTLDKINSYLTEIEKLDLISRVEDLLRTHLYDDVSQLSRRQEMERDPSRCLQEMSLNSNESSMICDSSSHQMVSLDIVCYGIGSLISSIASQYQLTLLNLLKNNFQVPPECCCIYDPLLGGIDRKILSILGYTVLTVNEEGKRTVRKPTLFYMPHCGKALYNNLLWANWLPDRMNNVIILGNSFTHIETSTPRKLLEAEALYIVKIMPFMVEYPIENTFHHNDIFNNLSLHVIDRRKLNSVDQSYWNNCPEPQYNDDTMDIIMNLK